MAARCGKLDKGAGDDVAARLADAVPPILVPRRVGPQVFRIGLDRGDDILGRMRVEVLGKVGDDALPLPRRLAKGSEDRVVEIEQNGARQIGHVSEHSVRRPHPQCARQRPA